MMFITETAYARTFRESDLLIIQARYIAETDKKDTQYPFQLGTKIK